MKHSVEKTWADPAVEACKGSILHHKQTALLFGFGFTNPSTLSFGGIILMLLSLLLLLRDPARLFIFFGVLFVKELLGFPDWSNHGFKMS